MSPAPPLSALPIDEVLPEAIAALREKPNLVLRAATGAGKTTRVPPALLAAGLGPVVMLEPRRVATRAAARRMAEENGWRLGEEVGYQVRFERRARASTRLLVVTEGILVHRLQKDPFLEGIGALVFDEFHERHLASDLSLAMARKVQREARPDLRLVVMSATLDAEPLVEFLGGEGSCASVQSAGRLFPVEIDYQPRPDARGLPTLVRESVIRELDRSPGDLLVFLPGVGEIRKCEEFLEPVAAARRLQVVPLFGDLAPEKQDSALRAGARRRVVLATNVAETSVTVEGVSAVIDSGQARVLRFDPGLGLDRLELTQISRASADQRAGRAGRERPGRCVRLWTELDHRGLRDRETPEIQRVDLVQTALELLVWGESDLEAFPWFEAPDSRSLGRALEVLRALGAIGGRCEPTALGRLLALVPAHPRLGRLLIAGHGAGHLEGAAIAAALLSERDIVFRPVGHRPVSAMISASSDVVDRVEAVQEIERTGYAETALGPASAGRARHVARVARQLAHLARSRLGDGPEPEAEEDQDAAIRRALLTAFPDRVARRRQAGGRRAVLVGGRGVKLSPMSAVHEAELFLAIEIDAGRGADGLVRQASAVEASWLEGIEESLDAEFDAESLRVVGRRRVRYRDLVLEEKDADPGCEAASRLLIEAASERLESALALDRPAIAGLLARLAFLRRWMPELGLPDLADEDFWRGVLPSLAAGRRSFEQLRAAPVLDFVRGSLEYPQLEALERHAPERLEVPSGSRIALDYGAGSGVGEPPVLAVRIQELFGLEETPAVAGGRVPVLLHLLAPNRRPQQVTRDLASFWRTTYGEVRKELAGRYPKHAWPEDPLSAQPTRGARRRGSRSSGA
ncbi:MAG: ATP-dependent helicase HrpB [Acidobacteriota bacterium]